MSRQLCVIIVEKTGELKALTIKDYKEDELFKKCGFRKGEDFIQHAEWNVKITGAKYNIAVYAKNEGRANSENKYDFPPPIDNHLFFGSCAIVAKDAAGKNVDLSLELWTKIYEKLFGGFEDLASTAQEDEDEEDELANVPKEKKTKQGYLKDGFVVDSSDMESDSSEDDVEIEDIGSELSEDSYE
jgi:hypothetical protein